jgi:hypothetical protein
MLNMFAVKLNIYLKIKHGKNAGFWVITQKLLIISEI